MLVDFLFPGLLLCTSYGAAGGVQMSFGGYKKAELAEKKVILI